MGKGVSGLFPSASGVEPGAQNAGAPSTSAPGASPREAPPSVPLFEQVAMKMTPLPDGAHDVELRLNPEHLGKLKIELHIDSGRMDASVQADNSEARALLLREEPALREALRNAGVTLSSFNVALSGEPWREKKGAPQSNGDADSAPRRGRNEEPVEGVTSVHGVDVERDGMNRTEHWIA
ncbi:MAG: flagellar hook-length control protein FliK [Candidatus Deferrimicrobiaceae bacterium]